MTSQNPIFYGRPEEGFKMVRDDTEVDVMRRWKCLWIDDVVQKMHLHCKQSSERL